MSTTCAAILAAASNVKPIFASTLFSLETACALGLALVLLGAWLYLRRPARNPRTVSKLTAFGGTHIGGRTNNEDAFLVKGPLFVIADGMGGQACGEVASNTLIETFDCCEQSPRCIVAPPKWFERSIMAANIAMRDVLAQKASCAGFGTTVVAARRNGQNIELGWAGDSHFFRLRGGVLERLTVEHSLAVKIWQQGLITEAQIATHRFRNTLYRYVAGTLTDPEFDELSFAMEPGDVYLLCSDGLVDYSDLKRVQQILESADTPEHKVAALLAMAVADNTKDNATAIVIHAT